MTRTFPAALVLFALLTPNVAAADPGDDVAARVNAAFQRARSYAIRFMWPNGMTAGHGVVVTAPAPALSLALDVEGAAVQMTLLDGIVYQKLGDQSVSNQFPGGSTLAAHAIPHLDAASVRVLPNVREGRTELGALRIDARAGFDWLGSLAASSLLPPQGPATCTYDLATARLQKCVNDVLTVRFGEYGSPANVVRRPAR